ncbi:MAG: hypothetical protein P8Y45_19670 [Exilibacterium sp.]
MGDKKALVPRLRFPEFRDAGEWEVKKAKFLFSNRVGQGKEGLPIYSVTMNDSLVKRDSPDRKIDDIEKASRNKKAHKHDIVYNIMRMWQGASGVAKSITHGKEGEYAVKAAGRT